MPGDRRRFLTGTLMSAAGLSLSMGHAHAREPTASGGGAWRMPDEAEPHACTWMAFGASASVWGESLLPVVRRNLALLASTIARHEPVRLLVRPRERAIAQALLDHDADVTLIDCALDDLWIRDTGPAFVLGHAGALAAVDLNFNGWGRKQAHALDAKVAALVAHTANVLRLQAALVMEGGCIEVDGEGTAIITESCTLNGNRNPGISKAEFEDVLMPLMGLDKIVWLPGIRGRDITDGHTDFYARFAGPGVVLAGLERDPDQYDYEVTRTHLQILRGATDARGRRLQVHVLESPARVRPRWESDDFAAGYVGFYVCNGAVVMQQFGDRAADANARATLARAFPGRMIEALDMDGIAAGGGSIHCATQQQPA